MCPECFLERRLIARSFFLVGMFGCPNHLVRLVDRCPCGQSLMRSNGTLGVPRCSGCGRQWTELPVSRLEDGDARRLTDLHVAYAMLLGLPSVNVRARVLRVARTRQQRAGAGTGVVLASHRFHNLSLSRLATLVVALGVDDRLVTDLLAEDAPKAGCPNATCLYFQPLPAVIGERESHCHYCGCRFRGRRILTSFDLGHGGTEQMPSDRTVRRAIHRLDRWRRKLKVACSRLRRDGATITVDASFRAAGVPLRANLRASRLGLVDIVAEAAREQRLERGLEAAEFSSLTMDDYRDLRRAVREIQAPRAIGPVNRVSRLAGLTIARDLHEGTLRHVASGRPRERRDHQGNTRRPRPRSMEQAEGSGNRDVRVERLRQAFEMATAVFPDGEKVYADMATIRAQIDPTCPHCGRASQLAGRQRTCVGCGRIWGLYSTTALANAHDKPAILRAAFVLANARTPLLGRDLGEVATVGVSRSFLILSTLRTAMSRALDFEAREQPASLVLVGQQHVAVVPISRSPRLFLRESYEVRTGLIGVLEPNGGGMLDELVAEFTAWNRDWYRGGRVRQQILDEWAFRQRHPDPHDALRWMSVGLILPSTKFSSASDRATAWKSVSRSSVVSPLQA
jgi:transposase-like protein